MANIYCKTKHLFPMETPYSPCWSPKIPAEIWGCDFFMVCILKLDLPCQPTFHPVPELKSRSVALYLDLVLNTPFQILMFALPVATSQIIPLGCGLRMAPGKGLSYFCLISGTLWMPRPLWPLLSLIWILNGNQREWEECLLLTPLSAFHNVSFV